MDHLEIQAGRNVWEYRWSMEASVPMVLFFKPGIGNNIIYDAHELEKTIREITNSKRFSVIPVSVMQAALTELQNTQIAA